MEASILNPETVKKEWDLADGDKSGTLSLKEITKLLEKLNLKLKDKEVKKSLRKSTMINLDN